MANIIDCPSCHRRLRVPDELLGTNVKCPTCGAMFTTTVPEGPRPAAGQEPYPEPPAQVPEQERLSASPQPPRPSQPMAEAAGRRDAFDFPDRRDVQPHRATMILVLGILALVTGCGIILGPIAWVMGSNDLREMRAGRMDREGQGMTDAGRICGMIATILAGMSLVLCCGYFLVIAGIGFQAAGRP